MSHTVCYVAATSAAATDGAAALERADQSLDVTGVADLEALAARVSDADCVVFAETPTTASGAHLLDVLEVCRETPTILYSDPSYGPKPARGTDGIDGYVRRDGAPSVDHLADAIRWCCHPQDDRSDTRLQGGPTTVFEALPVPAIRFRWTPDVIEVTAVTAGVESRFGHGPGPAHRLIPDALDPTAESGPDAFDVSERLLPGGEHRTTRRYWTPEGVCTCRVVTTAVAEAGDTVDLVSTFVDLTESRRTRRHLEAAVARLHAVETAIEQGERTVDVAETAIDLFDRTGEDHHLDEVSRAHDKLRDRFRSAAAAIDGQSPRETLEPVGLHATVARAWSIVDPTTATLERGSDLVFDAQGDALCEALVSLFGGWIAPRIEDRAVSVSVDATADGFSVTLEVPNSMAVPPTETSRLRDLAGTHGWAVTVDEPDSSSVHVTVEGLTFDDPTGSPPSRWHRTDASVDRRAE